MSVRRSCSALVLRVGLGHLTLAGQHAFEIRHLFLQFSGAALGAGELIADLRETAVRGVQPLLLQLQASEGELHAGGGGGHLFYRGAESANLLKERRHDVSAVRGARCLRGCDRADQQHRRDYFALFDVS